MDEGRAANHGRVGPVVALDGAEAVVAAAIAAFAEFGYHGTSVRELAQRQGLSVAALYYHFPSKLAVLVAIMKRAMDDIISDMETALADAAPDPVSRLSAVVRAHVLFHTRRQAECFIGNSEIRSLSGADLAAILERRDHAEALVRGVVREGIQVGAFDVASAAETTRAVLAMCTAVSGWYTPRGSFTPEAVADRYVHLALRQVAVRRLSSVPDETVT